MTRKKNQHPILTIAIVMAIVFLSPLMVKYYPAFKQMLYYLFTGK
ncbi:hypothetical protein [Chitinophaga sp.]|nr:hypothetical protein [Chitinophaga sp.]